MLLLLLKASLAIAIVPLTSWQQLMLLLGVQFKVCHGSLYAVMWLVDEPREFNLPTLPQRCITYVPEKLPRKYGDHSKEYLPIRSGRNVNCFETCTEVVMSDDNVLCLSCVQPYSLNKSAEVIIPRDCVDDKLKVKGSQLVTRRDYPDITLCIHPLRWEIFKEGRKRKIGAGVERGLVQRITAILPIGEIHANYPGKGPMMGLCEGGNEPPGSLNINKQQQQQQQQQQ
ncbi:hypothetical protein ANN_23845 [Periplaneta americana]|uniref:Uncharacterized protein n=1 Tax=Periplaneta americana TaxID=6978 RepID=A0ABQ8SM82_PERAM|nr:hypothetical protein ANN_23845 [Periplaneta americana]